MPKVGTANPPICLSSLELGELDLRHWLFSQDRTSAQLLDEVCRGAWGDESALSGLEAEVRTQILAEPHVLGWAFQHLGADTRNASFKAHNQQERKHSDSTISTQLFTPRWVADFLVWHGMNVSGPCDVLDPACGGGQMLLAWVDQLIARGVAVEEAFKWVRGVDLDPIAVETCRESLKLHAFRYLKRRDPALELSIDAAILCKDALMDDIPPASFVLTNPPYQGARSMAPSLRAEIRRHYMPFHHDLYTAFIKRCADLSKGAIAVLAQQTIWYLARYERARHQLLSGGHLHAFAHLGPGVFRSLSGEKANVVAFIYEARVAPGSIAFWDARTMDGDAMRAALVGPAVNRDLADFEGVPGVPLAHWVSSNLLGKFQQCIPFGEIADIPGSQNKTGANGRYVRLKSELKDDSGIWVPYSKGGPFSPWYGDWKWVVDWSEEARDFYAENPTSNLLAEKYWFREGLTYTDFAGQSFNARWMPKGCVFDMAGPAIFHPEDNLERLAGWLVLLNSSPVRQLLNALNPSIHYQVRDLRRLPIPELSASEWESLAHYGRSLIAQTRLMIDKPVTRAGVATLRDLERSADKMVCSFYGVREATDPPIHSLFRMFSD